MQQKSSSFFFSKILGKNIIITPDTVFGRLNDMVLDLSGNNPVIASIEVKNGHSTTYISADYLEISHDGHEHYQVMINSDHLRVMPPPGNGLFLARNFLDKQIVDVHGRKVERVNDVRLGMTGGRWKVVAVDIGLRGLLRRLGLEYVAIRINSLSRKEFRNKLISWDTVQPISSGLLDLQLSTSMNKLTTLHAADIADIIEKLDRESQMQLMHGLDDETAAEVLEEMDEEKQQALIKTMPDERASDLLEIMPSDEAADILENVDDTRAEVLLDQMESDASNEIRELMEYEDATVGSVMTKEFSSFRPETTVAEVVSALKNGDVEEETSHYVYITDRDEHLLGLVTLLDLAASQGSALLGSLMSDQLLSVNDEDHLDVVMDLMQKYNLQMVPVKDTDGVLVGIILLNDLIHEYVRLRRIQS